MITDHQKLEIPSLSPNQKPLELDINFRGDLREVEKYKDQVVRFKIGKEVTEVNFEQLWSLFFAMSSPEQQTAMVPTSNLTNRKIEVEFVLRADQDIAKGELIPIKHYVTLPEDRFIDMYDEGYKKAKIAINTKELQTL